LRENRHEARGLASTHSAPGGPPAVPDRGQHVPQSRQLGGGAARDRLMLMRNARPASAEAVNGPLLGGQTKKSHAAADKFWIHYPRAFSSYESIVSGQSPAGEKRMGVEKADG